VLIEALPYLRRYHGKTFVIKYGGAAMADEALKAAVTEDVVWMHYVGLRPIVVHGGGPEITAVMRRLGKEATFVNGLRVTDAETIQIVEMVLAGKTNKGIVALLQGHGAQAVGLSGKDGNLLVAERHAPDGVDLGFVGAVKRINPGLLHTLSENGYIPVISSVATGTGGETFNINADTVAGQLAAELHAEKLILLTDVPGILADVADPNSLIRQVDRRAARDLLSSGRVGKGMIPKIEACLHATERGVPRAHILDGRTPRGLLIEVFTDSGVGTMIMA
jgi:acetylglutamate kinase